MTSFRAYLSLSLLLLLSSVYAATAAAQASQPAYALLLDPPLVSSSTSLPDDPSFLPQAESPTPTTPQESAQQRRARLYAESQRQLHAQKSQRILGVVPNFNTVLNGQALPLTPAQKWDLAMHSSIDPFYFATAFVLAGYSEIDDTHQGYHWGPSGYFKRVGANYADTVNGTLIGNALLPILFKQDPRYFRKGKGSIKSRILYSALSTIVCRGDSGRQQPNYSNVLGNFVSGAISNIYYPSDETGLELTLTNGVVVTAEGALGAQFLEFAPDLTRLLHRANKPSLHTNAPPPPEDAPK